MLRAIVALLFAFGSPAMTLAILGPPGRDLVTLTMTLDKSVHRRGDPIRVTLVLRAGARVVFLPDFFSDFNETCERGFGGHSFLRRDLLSN